MNRVIQIACYVVAALLLLGAAAQLIFGRDKPLGVFLVLIAAVISRVLVLNIALPMENQQKQTSSQRDST